LLSASLHGLQTSPISTPFTGENANSEGLNPVLGSFFQSR
jgi:hypothetical protein